MKKLKTPWTWPVGAVRILDAALKGDRRLLELTALTTIRDAKSIDPAGAQLLGEAFAAYQSTASSARWANTPPPVDADSTLALLRVQSNQSSPKPVLSGPTTSAIERFVRERRELGKLLAVGLQPPSSLLLCGPPGTGKTMLAKWLASELALPIATLDLATAVSSFLGRTGANLRRILDYARSTPMLLLLDEFDSVAKRRDDVTEVGELKRIVNVLLKELEDWPMTSVLVAATNHASLLDPAVFRRFDHTVELELPDESNRIAILVESLGSHAEGLDPAISAVLAKLTNGASGSAISQLGNAILRTHFVDGTPLATAALAESKRLVSKSLTLKEKAKLIKQMGSLKTGKLPLRELSEMFDLSISTIHYHLSKE